MALSETPLYDPFAEIVVVGCCIDTPDGTQLAHQRLEPDDFHDPVLADLFAHAPNLPPVDPHNTRRTAAATAANIRPADIHAICDARPVMADTGGRYANRVAQASHRRLVRTIVDNAATAVANDDPDQAADALQTALTLIRSGP